MRGDDDVPSYTLVNLKTDVEDMAPKFGFAPNMESRFARKPLELENSGISYFRVAPDYHIPFGHHHVDQEEIYLIVSGSARMKLDDEIIDLRQWDVLRVSPEVTRGFEGGPDGAEVIAFGAPSNDNKDVEMVEGWWA
jgi:mannose-6-phosphate isomerase-like protein (cupin superfamily)